MGNKERNSNRSGWGLGVGCFAGYLVLLVLLVWAEKTDPEASIHSLADALWYSIVTISTVGYGDLYPVTPLGKMLGISFVLMSVGVLSFLIGAAVSFFTGSLMPALKRRRRKNKMWYVFSEVNEGALALAEDLLDREDCLCLFPRSQEAEIPGHLSCLCYDSMEAVLREKKDGCQVLCMRSQPDANYTQALKLLEFGHPVYCNSRLVPDRSPKGLTLFHDVDCCARSYWQEHPLKRGERSIVLIGDGQYARQILFRGLQSNVLDEKQQVIYHLFGDWGEFRRNHHQLGATMAIDRIEPERDSLLFHGESWNAEEALILQADRILICGDDAGENLGILGNLRQYFPVRGWVHTRAAAQLPEETVFGTYEQTCTAEFILKSKLSSLAEAMHNIYHSGADYPVPSWEELSEFTRQSNISAADHLAAKVRILLEDDSITALTPEHCSRAYEQYKRQRKEKADYFRGVEHLRWMRFHSLYNWRYGPVRDNGARIHPMMLPYDQLAPEEQRKDDYAWELLGEIKET